MKKISLLAMLVLIALFAFGVENVRAQKKSKKQATVWPADAIKWQELKMKGGPPGIMYANAWGKLDKGGYGAFIKLPAGIKNPLHTHSSDVKLVILAGSFYYAPEGGTEQSLGAGSYLMVPGGLKHTSGTSDAGATVFQESTGKFDMRPVGAPAKTAKKTTKKK